MAIEHKQSHIDHILFIKHSSSGKVTILLIYGDGIIVTRYDNARRQYLD